MADATYQPKVYKDSGGDRQTVASGGSFIAEAGAHVQLLGGGDLTATSDDLSKSAGVTPGTAAASKTAVLGASKNLDTLKIDTNFVQGVDTPAAAGNNQATATALTKDVNCVSAADDTKGVALPVGVAGMRITVINKTAGKILKVYPAVGATAKINALAQDAAISLAAGVPALFVAESPTQWWTMPLLPS